MLEKFEDLLGTTLTDVEIGKDKGNDEVIFTLDNGEQYKLYHNQDCCESVVIEDINGDLNALVGTKILMAEEAANSLDGRDSQTWTFYKLATVKGYVTIRWFGESNGYYSEDVDWAAIEI